MKTRRLLFLLPVVVIAVCAYWWSSLAGTRHVKVIWRQTKAGTYFEEIMPCKQGIGILASTKNECSLYPKYSLCLLDPTGRILATREVGPEDAFLLPAGASRDRPLFCLITKKDKRFVPLIVDMQKGRVYHPTLEGGRHATPMPYLLPPNTPALCPSGKCLLLSGHDKKSGKTRHWHLIVDALSGKVIREVADTPKGRDSFYHYVWNDDCTLTWLDEETGLIRNEKKGVLSSACKGLFLNLPSGMRVKLSPDASTLAVFNAKATGKLDVAFYDTMTGKKTYQAHGKIGKSEIVHGVYWSPDSSKVCVGLESSSDSDDIFTRELYVIGQDKAIRKISLRGWQFFGYYGSMVWLQDSKHVACLLFSRKGEHRALALFDVDRP